MATKNILINSQLHHINQTYQQQHLTTQACDIIIELGVKFGGESSAVLSVVAAHKRSSKTYFRTQNFF